MLTRRERRACQTLVRRSKELKKRIEEKKGSVNSLQYDRSELSSIVTVLRTINRLAHESFEIYEVDDIVPTVRSLY